jgi:para-aminobenzoate synthetase component I
MIFEQFVSQLDAWGKSRTPFFFLIDFEMKNPVAFELGRVPASIQYNFNGRSNSSEMSTNSPLDLDIHPVEEQNFKTRFDFVHQHLSLGDSYLTNLTVRTRIDMSVTLEEAYARAKAKYKLLYKNDFLVFSPETFVQIKDGMICSYPMKGTIDASIENAAALLLHDNKELAEHVTIVDLIRNDLSMVAHDVNVVRFRYLEKITSNRKTLLQASSEIQGSINREYKDAYGSILKHLLPAGSISGAPKSKTIEIIKQAEARDRGYYTGVAGVFDGNLFDSGVLIRFIENDHGKLFYRSGGGITAASDWQKEYSEVIDKIYVPVN